MRPRDLISAHAGGRCVVLGNGPSLTESVGRVKLLRASGWVLLGSNRVYLPGGVMPDYLAVTDYLLERDCRDELAPLARRTRMVLDETLRAEYPPDARDRIVWFENDKSWYQRDGVPSFWRPSSPDTFHAGGTVTYTLLQLAFLMGFREVVLLGVDHRYIIPEATEIRAGGIFVSHGPDPNHFNPDYFGKGRWYHDPMPERMAISYQVAERVLSAAGVDVCNGTPGSALTVFPMDAA